MRKKYQFKKIRDFFFLIRKLKYYKRISSKNSQDSLIILIVPSEKQIS